MPTNSKNTGISGNNLAKNKLSQQRAHKRWYPPLTTDVHHSVHNANRFTWDALYQLREQIKSVANAAGLTNVLSNGVQTSVAARVASSPSSAGDPPSGTSYTGPSNSQILGLNVKAVVPTNSQSLVYNSASGQFEPTNTITWTTSLPAHHNSPGIQGTIAFDPTGADTHLYVCISSSPPLWGRVTLDESF